MEEKSPSVGKTLREYGESTSAHGIPRAVTTKSAVRRFFWTCMFLASFSYFLYQACQLGNKYMNYPVTTDVQIQWSELEFPAVTICNANPLRLSQLMLYGGKDFQNAGFIPTPVPNVQSDVAQVQEQQQLNLQLPPTARTSRTTQDSLDQLGLSVTRRPSRDVVGPNTDARPGPKNLPSVLDDLEVDFKGPHDDFTTVRTFTTLIANLNTSTREAIGHQPRDFIQDCQFDGRPCSPRNFTLFTDSAYGNCFTFNKAQDDRAPLSATSAGPLHGLSLVLYIEQEEYVPSVAEKAGARVVVHPPDRWPFPEFEGFDVPPGFLTSAGLRLTSITRLGGQYGECTNGEGHELLYPGTYTQTNCLVTCHQHHMISVCGCADATLRAPENTTICGTNSSTIVTSLVEAKLECEQQVKRDMASGSLPCTCPASCSDKVYGKEIGLAEWPANSYLGTVMNRFKTRKAEGGRGPGAAILDDPDQFKQNLLKVNIYYEALNYEIIDESPGYEVESLLGDLGGQLGLWVGMSLLSAMEIIEVIADLFVILCKKMRSKEMRSSKVDVASSNETTLYNNHAFSMKENI